MLFSGTSRLSPAVATLFCSRRKFQAAKPFSTVHRQRRRHCFASQSPSSDGQQLAAEFSSFVNSAGVASPMAVRQPSHLLPPTGAVAAQMDALQRNDYPDPDSGVRVAFAFAKPLNAEDFTPLSVPSHVRSWQAAEEYLGWEQFCALLHSPPYSVLLDCAEWRVASNLVFPSRRHESKAVLAVEVTAPRQRPGQAGSRAYTFTFCLERVERGPLKVRKLSLQFCDASGPKSQRQYQ